MNTLSNNLFRDISHVTLFDGENWNAYSYEFLSMMEQFGLKSLLIEINGIIETIPSTVTVDGVVTNQNAIDEWRARDVKCRNYILATNQKSQKENLYGMQTAREMWVKMETQYASTAMEIESTCLTSLYQYKYDPAKDITSHVNRAMQYASKLREIGQPLEDRHLINIINASLPEAFVRVRSNWNNVPITERTLTNLTAKLQAEEKIIASYVTSTKQIDSAFIASGSNGPSGQAGPSNQIYNPNATGQSRFFRELMNKGADGKYLHGTRGRGDTKRGRGRGGFNSRGGFIPIPSTPQLNTDGSVREYECIWCSLYTHKTADCNKLARAKEETRREFDCTWCEVYTHKTKNCRKMKRAKLMDDTEQDLPSESELDLAYPAAVNFEERSASDWFCDSAATTNMTDNKDLIRDFVPIEPGTWVIKGIGGMEMPVHGHGHVKVITQINGIESSETIQNVAYVPGIGLNLFSIAEVTEIPGMVVTFVGPNVNFHHNRKLVFTGERAGRTLYHLHAKSTTNREDTAYVTTINNSTPLAHRRMGHINMKTLRRMFNLKIVDGLKQSDLGHGENIPICSGCAKGKMHRLVFLESTRITYAIGELIHSDVCGPMSTISLGGFRYFVIFKDDFSDIVIIYFMKNKSEVFSYFRLFAAIVKNQTGRDIGTLRTDGGTEYGSSDFISFRQERGIKHETSCRYTPAQNGVAERTNRTVVEAARSMLHYSKAPLWLWGEAVAYAVYILNRVPAKNKSITPHEVFYKKKPDVSNIKVFGSMTFVLIPDAIKKKMDAKCLEGMLVGFDENSKGYRVYIPSQKKIVISRDVRIDESVMYSEKLENPIEKEPLFATHLDPFVDREIDEVMNQIAQPEELMQIDNQLQAVDPDVFPAAPVFENQIHANEVNNNQMFGIEVDPGEQEDDNQPLPAPEIPMDVPDAQPVAGQLEAAENVEHIPPHQRPLRSGRMPAYSKKFKIFKGWPTSDDDDDNVVIAQMDEAMSALMLDHDPQNSFTPFSILKVEPYIPISYTDAISCPEAPLWKKAIEEEHQSLIENETWEPMELPPGKKAIKCKWVLDFKPGYKGVDPRYKARLVACGYAQLFGIDYLDTYAPVVKHYSIRLVLAIVASRDLEMQQIDISTAFLNGELKEEVYIKQPEGYILTGKEDHVLRLRRTLYGLKQSSRCWYTRFDEAILKLGFKRCLNDPCVYYRIRQTGEYTILVIYVDDGLLCSNFPSVLLEVVKFLETQFKVRSLPANRFVGLDITRDRLNRKLWVTQEDFIRNILNRFNMDQCKPVSIPAKTKPRLSLAMCPTDDQGREKMKRVPYRECIGCLMYLMGMTRADIAFAVNQVAAFVQNPGEEQWAAVKHILAYLKKTINFGICYGGSTNPNLLGFTDADFASDLTKRQSTTGVLFIFNGGPVSWGSRRQRAIALSTTDAEFYAASEGARESIWIKNLLMELRIDVGQVSLRCDSNCALSIIHDGEHHRRTKHIDVKYFYVRDQQELGNLMVTYLPTKEMPADMFTKPLPRPDFEKFRSLIGIKELLK